MVETDQDLIQRLSEENPRFRKLHEEHILFEKKLQEYERIKEHPISDSFIHWRCHW